MQQVIDTINAGGTAVYPVFKGVIDFTTGILGGGNGTPTTATVTKPVEKIIEKQTIVQQLGGPNGFSFNRNFIRIAGLSGAMAVALGAYGSHGIEMNPDIEEEQKRSFRSANLYHFIGTFGLIASSLARRPAVSGSLMAVGTFVFCGACYTYAVTGDAKFKKYAPFGGTTLILAWLSLVL